MYNEKKHQENRLAHNTQSEKVSNTNLINFCYSHKMAFV